MSQVLEPSNDSRNSLRTKFYILFNLRSLFYSLPESANRLVDLLKRVLAPLRRIVARELEVFAVSRVSGHPTSFAVHDRLECGHTRTSLLWDVFDLLNGYTQSAHVRAVRHRCHECMTLVATKKPPMSVTASKTAAVA